MKYDYLHKLKDNFVSALQHETINAKTETDMGELVDIATDLLYRMPIELLHKDFFTRSSVKSYVPEFLRDNTKFINGLMNHIYEKDSVCFDDYVCERVSESVDEHIKEYKTLVPSADKFTKIRKDKIVMEKFDDNFGDYWDEREQMFVIFYGSAHGNYELAYDSEITDFDGKKWDCVLWDSEFDDNAQCWKAFYKKKGK